MTSQAYLKVIDTLDANGSKSRDVRANHAMYCCPAHEDRNPSLSVDDHGDRVMVHCHAGCHPDDVVAALGLELRDLFDGELDERDPGLPIRSYVYKRSNGEPWIIVDRWFPKRFTQRLPGTEPGDRHGLGGREPLLWRAEKLWPAMQAGDATVWLVEGEKDVETCERHGLLATCTLGGAGKWHDNYTAFLRHAKQVMIVADQDMIKPNGTLGAGQQHAIAAYTALKARGIRARIVAPAVGKDASDHFLAGYGPEDFAPEPTAITRPRGMCADELMRMEFTPVAYAVDKILPAGLTIFAGSPKAGKSFAALDICLAVAAGGPALSHLGTTQGCTIYLAREDTYRRLQSRMALLMSGTMDAPKALEVIPQEQDWPGGDEGLANLTEWAESCGSPRLVVLDTIAKVEPQMGEDGRHGAYSGNYSMMAKYKTWADNHNCAVVMIHHDRKQGASTRSVDGDDGWMQDDPFTRISGTRGLTGAADTLWFLETKRGTPEGRLHITGRDVVEQSLELRKAGPLWCALDIPE